jgi:hypothetical protein
VLAEDAAVDVETAVVAVVAAVVDADPTALVLMGAGRFARDPAVACDSLIPANR